MRETLFLDLTSKPGIQPALFVQGMTSIVAIADGEIVMKNYGKRPGHC